MRVQKQEREKGGEMQGIKKMECMHIITDDLFFFAALSHSLKKGKPSLQLQIGLHKMSSQNRMILFLTSCQYIYI